MEKITLILVGKFRKDSNGCAVFSIPHEESKKIDFKKKYLVKVEGNIAYYRSAHNKLVINSEDV